MTSTETDQPRTVLEYLVRRQDRTHDELAAEFDEIAAALGERVTLSARHLRRLASGGRDTASPPTRRVLHQQFGHPFSVLRQPWSPGREADFAGDPVGPAPALAGRQVAQAIQHTFIRAAPCPGSVSLVDGGQQSLGDEALAAWQARQQRGATAPHLTVIGGFAGSGKTEFGRFLSSITGWTLLDKDTITRPLTEHLLVGFGSQPTERESEVYLGAVRPLEYQCLMSAAYENLDCGVSTITAAPFVNELDDEDWVRRLVNRCASFGARLSVVWMSCDPGSMHEYLTSRSAARDTWKLSHWDEWLAGIDLRKRPACDYTHVDNRLNAAVSLTDQARALVARTARTAP